MSGSCAEIKEQFGASDSCLQCGQESLFKSMGILELAPVAIGSALNGDKALGTGPITPR